MGATTLFIIRHGEKPVPGDPSPGLTPSGSADPTCLTIRGWQRAGAWAALFGAAAGEDYPMPTLVYASDPSRSPEDGPPSQRPYQTVVPLSAKLGKGTQAHFAQGEEAALAADIAQREGVMLVAWEHKRIMSDLLPHLLHPGLPGVPTRWQGKRFDVAFCLRRADGGAPWSFRQMMPHLLGGDLDTPM